MDKDKIQPFFHPTWWKKLEGQFDKGYMQKLSWFVQERRKHVNVYPRGSEVFEVFKRPFDEIQVVLMAQDPYHNPLSAHGLAFSIHPRSKYQNPSLDVIFSEMGVNRSSCLDDLADQGVFMFNSVLTVEQGQPKSHYGKGWEIFTARVIRELNAHPMPLAFCLWGNDAKKYSSFIDDSYHLLLEAPHPAAELRTPGIGFSGCGHFKRIDEFLWKTRHRKICWKGPSSMETNQEQISSLQGHY